MTATVSHSASTPESDASTTVVTKPAYGRNACHGDKREWGHEVAEQKGGKGSCGASKHRSSDASTTVVTKPAFGRNACHEIRREGKAGGGGGSRSAGYVESEFAAHIRAGKCAL
eukprot:356934-Chlamydomonas_euryale.AAC.6